MKLRVQVAFSCLAVIVLVMVLLFGERSAGSLDVRQERILIKETPDQVIPVLSKALTDNSPDVRIRAAKAFYGLDPVQAQKAGAAWGLQDAASAEKFRDVATKASSPLYPRIFPLLTKESTAEPSPPQAEQAQALANQVLRSPQRLERRLPASAERKAEPTRPK